MKKTFLLKVHAFQEGLLFLLIGGALTWYSLDGYSNSFNKKWVESPFLFPLVIATMLTLLAFVLLYQSVKQAVAMQPKQADDRPKGQSIRVLVVLGLCLLYYLALCFIKLPYMGGAVFGLHVQVSTFELATLVFLVALMAYLGVRSKSVLILVPVLTTVVLSLIFRSMLYVLLP